MRTASAADYLVLNGDYSLKSVFLAGSAGILVRTSRNSECCTTS
ncbi:MAG: hypothetical protein R2912_09525 [Eubacteriales bacterium]